MRPVLHGVSVDEGEDELLPRVRRKGGALMGAQRCGRCMHYRGAGGGVCLVYGSRVSADEHHVTDGSAITGEDYGCENFVTPEADEEWCRALERAERRPVPWR